MSPDHRTAESRYSAIESNKKRRLEQNEADEKALQKAQDKRRSKAARQARSYTKAAL